MLYGSIKADVFQGEGFSCKVELAWIAKKSSRAGQIEEEGQLGRKRKYTCYFFFFTSYAILRDD